MLNVIFTIVLGINTYSVVNSCTDQGGVYFNKDDSENRVLSLCKDTISDQVIEHELLHICLHDHKHSFKTDKELNKHLVDDSYTEEYFASTVAPCLVANQDKLYTALERYHVFVPVDGESDRSRVASRKDKRKNSQSSISSQ